MRSLLASLLLFLSCVCVAASNHDGSIRGVLVDEYGEPVARAEVMTMDADPTPGVVEVQSNAPWTESDEHGRFTLHGLISGHHYKLFGKMEMQGYPDMSDGVYNPDGKAVVAVASATPEQEVTVSLGAKAALLQYSATDATTGKPIQNLTVSVERVDHKGAFGGSAFGNQVLLPADADVIVGVTARGYKTWYYPGGDIKDSARPVRAQSGETRQISAQLQPE